MVARLLLANELKVSLIWCSDSSEESSQRGDRAQAKAETADFLEIGLEAMAWPGPAVWLDRLLNLPVVLGAKRRIAEFRPKK